MEGYEKLGYMALNVSNVGRSKEFYERQVGLQRERRGRRHRLPALQRRPS